MPPKKIKETQAENGDQPVAKRPARNAKKRLPDDEVDSGSLQASNKRKKVSAEQVDPEAKQTKRKRTAPASKEIGSPAKEPKEKQKAQRGRKKKVVAASDSADEPKATSNEPTTSTSEPASTEPAATKPAKGRGKKVDQPPAAENVIDEGNRSEDESELVIDLKDEQPAASASPAKKRGRKPKANTKEVSTESKTVEDAQPSGDVQPSADAQPATESSDKPSKRPRAKKQKTEKSAAEVATEVQADASEAPALNTESEITDAPAAEDAQPAGDNQSATETSDKPVKRVRAKKQANATKVPADTTDAPAKRGKRKVPPVKEDNEVSSTNDKDNSTGKPTDKPDATAEQPNKPVDASKTAATECHDSDVQTVLCDIKSQVEKSSLTGGGLEDLREAQTT